MNEWAYSTGGIILKYLVENLSQCHFVYHIFHIDWPGIEPSLCGERLATNHVSYGTACRM